MELTSIPIDTATPQSQTDPKYGWPIPDAHMFQKVIQRGLRPASGFQTNSVIRSYNEAVVNWCEAVTVVAGTKIPCIISAPQRAFADFGSMIERRLKTPWPQMVEDQTKIDRHPLPFGCITPSTMVARPTVGNDNYPIRNIGLVDSSGKRRTAYTRYPKPMFKRYEIVFYCRQRNHSDFIEEKMLGQFWNGIATWSMPHPLAVLNPGDEVADRMMVRLHYKSHAVTDDLSNEADADRLIKVAFSVDVELWIWFDLLQAPTALRDTIVIEVVDDKSGANPEVIGSVSHAEPEAPPSVH